MKFIDELKNSMIGAFAIMGVALSATLFVGIFQYINVLLPFLGNELVLGSGYDYIIFFCGCTFGIIFLLILEWLRILKIHVPSFKETSPKEED